jgi:hypothetical protein
MFTWIDFSKLMYRHSLHSSYFLALFSIDLGPKYHTSISQPKTP